ncbi:carboxymuconolactone decarboxylase Related Protein [Acidaminococcus sp. CAG:917]|nr:carboxymuconolactone decarboxylase Related Protein [Acidaminococcus sp. CAG:917]
MNRIERTDEKFKELFKAMPSDGSGTDGEFMQILQKFIFGEVFYLGSLDSRTRELVTVTVLTVNQTLP